MIVQVKRKMVLVTYAMGMGEENNSIIVTPKEGRRIINEFKETGKFNYRDISKGFTYDKETDKPIPFMIGIEPQRVIMSHISDIYSEK